jgi:hypothetical protein
MSGWVLLTCVLMGGFMAWRDRCLSARKPPAIPIYLAGVLGALGGAYGGRLLIQDPGSLGGEVALALLFSVGGGGLAAGLVDLVAQRRKGPPSEAAAP